jgi:hypothetical protein
MYAECPTRAREAREKARRLQYPLQRAQTDHLYPQRALLRPEAPARTALEQVLQQPLQVVTVQERAMVERPLAAKRWEHSSN